ncbi:MAG: tetratricopeptide repeat protein [Proteobacteria bacterium]|nr:tetratricopeptide repeat protein [Pseudomonadota bacterium]
MNILNRLHLPSALLIGTLLLSAGVHADEMQDATQLFKQGQQVAALSKVNNFLVNKPRDAQGRFLKGLILTEQAKIADAIKIFSDLTQDYPELPEPYNNLAVLYASQGQYDKAKSALEMAIRTHPSYATAHENLGDIYAKMASQAYDRALQLDSSNTATQTKLAMIQDLFSDKPRNKLAAQRSPAIPSRPLPIAEAPVAKPAPAATVPAKTLPPAKAEAPVISDKARDVQEAVEGWADAWSSKNVKKYLAHYAADFETPDGESRKAWAETRKERISRPKHIEVKVSNIAVDFTDSTHATVKFRQNYRASGFKASGGKTLLMVKSGGNWLIQEERTH